MNKMVRNLFLVVLVGFVSTAQPMLFLKNKIKEFTSAVFEDFEDKTVICTFYGLTSTSVEIKIGDKKSEITDPDLVQKLRNFCEQSVKKELKKKRSDEDKITTSSSSTSVAGAVKGLKLVAESIVKMDGIKIELSKVDDEIKKINEKNVAKKYDDAFVLYNETRRKKDEYIQSLKFDEKSEITKEEQVAINNIDTRLEKQRKVCDEAKLNKNENVYNESEELYKKILKEKDEYIKSLMLGEKKEPSKEVQETINKIDVTLKKQWYVCDEAYQEFLKSGLLRMRNDLQIKKHQLSKEYSLLQATLMPETEMRNIKDMLKDATTEVEKAKASEKTGDISTVITFTGQLKDILKKAESEVKSEKLSEEDDFVIIEKEDVKKEEKKITEKITDDAEGEDSLKDVEFLENVKKVSASVVFQRFHNIYEVLSTAKTIASKPVELVGSHPYVAGGVGAFLLGNIGICTVAGWGLASADFAIGAMIVIMDAIEFTLPALALAFSPIFIVPGLAVAGGVTLGGYLFLTKNTMKLYFLANDVLKQWNNPKGDVLANLLTQASELGTSFEKNGDTINQKRCERIMDIITSKSGQSTMVQKLAEKMKKENEQTKNLEEQLKLQQEQIEALKKMVNEIKLNKEEKIEKIKEEEIKIENKEIEVKKEK